MTQVAGARRVLSQWDIHKTEVVVPGGVVTAKHPLASEVGLDVLDRGGNAVDAAVATAFATSVVLPFSNGLGGGGYIVAYLARERRTVVIDYSMTASRAAHETMYELVDGSAGSAVEGAVDLSATASPFGWHLVRNDENWRGWRSMAVPGTVMGLARALDRFGTISLAEAVAPAVRLAEDGWEMDWHSALSFSQQLDLIVRFPSSKAVFSRDGLPLRPRGAGPGDVLRNPALARTLRLIAGGGVDEFYRGSIARDIAADMREGGGLVTEEDLATYAVLEKEPLHATYRGLDLFAVPHACAGPTLVEGLKILEGFDLAGAGHNTPAYLHLLAEAFRRAYADRFAYMADPACVDVPWN
ncbi:MAG: gamma-glutamyltransferase family protein, partial [Dehalococcoidia bacterium]